MLVHNHKHQLKEAVILSEAKNLRIVRQRFFASLRMTEDERFMGVTSILEHSYFSASVDA